LTHKIRPTDYGLTFKPVSKIAFSKRIVDGLYDYYFLLQILHYYPM